MLKSKLSAELFLILSSLKSADMGLKSKSCDSNPHSCQIALQLQLGSFIILANISVGYSYIVLTKLIADIQGHSGIAIISKQISAIEYNVIITDRKDKQNQENK